MRRTITRLAIVATTLCSIALISFPSFPSTLGIVFKPQLVDRALKGNRLSNASAPSENGHKSQPSLMRTGKNVPLGCDRAFSSIGHIHERVPNIPETIPSRNPYLLPPRFAVPQI